MLPVPITLQRITHKHDYDDNDDDDDDRPTILAGAFAPTLDIYKI
jgi:hypothetical protein